jgi:5'-nucleotidase
MRDSVYSVDGTPTDCVLVAVNSLLPHKPDLIVSGINHGANLAEDVTYSGTVAAAIEGTLLGIPSIAVSVPRKGSESFEQSSIFQYAAEFTLKLVEIATKEGMPEDTLLNVNIPNCDRHSIKGVSITRLGKRMYRDVIEKEFGSNGQYSFRIGGTATNWEGGQDSDVSVIDQNMISITPLHLDLTNYYAVERLKMWTFE